MALQNSELLSTKQNMLVLVFVGFGGFWLVGWFLFWFVYGFFFLLKVFGNCQEVTGLQSVKILVIEVAIRAGHEICDDMSLHWKTLIRQSQKVSC